MRIVNRDGSISERINGRQIGHKNGIKTDKRIENLELLTRRQKANNFGKWARPIPSNRRCRRCKTSKTRIEKDGRHHWMRGHGDYAGGYLCYTCYLKEYRREHLRAHIVFYEKYHKVCILTDLGQIHFKNGNKKDIRIKNMVLLRRGGLLS